MMSQQIGFSILTAPLAAIDRRELSQAWYSALHLAHHSPLAAKTARLKNRLPEEPAQRTNTPAIPLTQPARGTMPSAVLARTQTARGSSIENERRGMRSTLARKIERTFLHPSAPATRATFSIGTTGERVHIALQTNAKGVRLVAVCAPRVRARVARALAQARYALARHGIVLDTDTMGAP